jgi:hypothetical protein
VTSLGHALGFLRQAQGADVLVSRGADVAAERIGERAPLHLAVADRGDLDAATGVHDGLLDGRALAGGEVRAAPEQIDGGLGERDALDGLAPPAGLHQQRHLLVEVDQERVLPHRRGPGAPHGLGLGQPDRVHRQPGRRTRDVGGKGCSAGDLRVLDSCGRGESPVPVDQHADAEPLRERAVDALHLLIADGERLAFLGDDASVGVGRACGLCGLHRLLSDVDQRASLPSHRSRP